MLPTCGERSGDEGAGDDDETPESPAEIDVARCGSKPYLGGVIALQGCTNRCSLAAGLRGNEERMRK